MEINKNIFLGLILMLLAILIFFTDFLNGIIRPITYLFLMGSSKGKDILFFALFGFILILSQFNFVKSKKNNYYLKIGILLSILILILGIVLEIIMRYNLGINLNTVFVSMNPSPTTTSILHSHIYKSIFGSLIDIIFKGIIPNGIHTGDSLYQYIPSIAKLFILILPAIFVFLILASSKRNFLTSILFSFFSSCMIIGIIDGGLFASPSIFGIIGLILIYRNEYYLNYYIGKFLKNKELSNYASKIKPNYKINRKSEIKFIINRMMPYIILIVILILRVSITFFGANTEYYEVEIINPDKNIDISNFSTLKIENGANKTILHLSHSYNELDLINNLKADLVNKCEYYVVSWNGFSYL